MSAPTSIQAWLDSLKDDSNKSSDLRLRALIDNPGAPGEDTSGGGFDDTDRPPLPKTSTAIRAAISDTFNYSEIAGTTVDDGERAILANSDTVMIAGRRRLRLRTDARAALLNQLREDPQYKKILSAAVEADQKDWDPICNDEVRRNSAWLRCFLVGDFSKLSLTPVEELRSALCAREQLLGVQLPTVVPSELEVRRQLGLAELLEPLRILIGSTGGWNGVDPATDRFVGRTTELEALRTHVDELESEGGLELVQRAFGRLGDALGRLTSGKLPGIFVISGQGGLGKSALVAKFVLDHVYAAQDTFPFCYIDFDRATLQAREPRILLMEVLRQLALQFPRFAERADDLRHSVRFEIQKEALDTRASEAPRNFDWPAARSLLRKVCQGHSFMLVLDTMEIVQSDERALRGVSDFIKQLCNEDFPEARIVLAGRADVPTLRLASEARAEGQLLRLQPLHLSEATEMAERLGSSWLGKEWNKSWASRLAGRARDNASRREPLTIRVAVELVRATSPEMREAVTRDIEKLGEKASDRFVGTLYQRRVLEHVQDKEVRKLAWPGLVLRRVSREIVDEVLAEICDLEVDEIPKTYDALAAEAWIVIRDGNYLKHQPELRARTLPLMRRTDKAKFVAVNRRAIRYFAARKESDLASRAEWIYHRLLAGEKPERVEPDWTPSLAPYLSGAEADFDPKTAAHQFLFAHTASKLASDQADALPATLAVEHIANTAPYLGNLYEETLSEVLHGLELEKVEVPKLRNQARLAFDTLAIKTGRWDLVDTKSFQDREGEWELHYAFASAFLTARLPSRDDTLYFASSGVPSISRSNVAAFIQSLAQRRRPHQTDTSEVREKALLEVIESGSWRPGPDHASTLRTAMIFSAKVARAAGLSWFELDEAARRRNPSTRVYSRAEIRALALSDGTLSRDLRSTDSESWFHVFGEMDPRPSVVTNEHVCLLVRDCLREYLKRTDPHSLHALRKFAAARNPDWVIPLAYACHSAMDGQLPKDLVLSVDHYEPKKRSFKQWPSSGGSQKAVPTDFLKLLNTADAAGDLYRVAVMIHGFPIETKNRSKDLEALYKYLGEWNSDIQRMLEAEQP